MIKTPQILRFQVMWTRLIALVEEQAQTLMQTAFSPLVRESGDLSAGVFDKQGRMLAQAMTGTPGHINTMARSVQAFLEVLPISGMAEGDVYITNDPWHGTGHLNDFVVVTPGFYKGRLIAFFACTAHITDVGGIGLSPEGRDIFSEGILIPIQKLADRGVLNRTLIEIAKANSRLPHELEGDLYSLMASNETAVRRVQKLLEEIREDDIDDLGNYIIDTSRAAAIKKISALPRTESSYRMRVDGFETHVDLVATLRVEGDHIHLDWTGTSGPSKLGINVPLNYASAYSAYALSVALMPDLPNNDGTLSRFVITAPDNCILNARRPQPVACRHIIGCLLPDVVLGCLDAIVPDTVPAESASALWTLIFRGGDPKKPFAITIVTNGGTGARPGIDGLSATSFPSTVKGTPVEVVEAATPLIFYKRELRPQSGGAGQWHGGMGQSMEIGVLDGNPFTLFAAFDRIDHPARGRAGGGCGMPGRLANSEGTLLSGKGAIELAADQRLLIETPGGGGYGSPEERSESARAADARAGYI